MGLNNFFLGFFIYGLVLGEEICTDEFCYYRSSEGLWANACGDSDGQLVSIHSQAENKIVTDLCDGLNCWIGINLTGDGLWEWNDGSCIRYENWWPKYPGDRNGHVKITSSGLWLPANEVNHNAVCKYRNPSAPTASPTVSQPTCHGDYCYYRSCHKRSYSSACVDHDAQLPIIQSTAENNIIRDLCNGFNCWIGINLTGNGPWEWNDGSCIHYENWLPNYPGDHIGHVKMLSNGKWLPSNNESKSIAICQYRNPSAPNASLIASEPTCYGDYCYYRSCHKRNYTSACVNHGAQLPTIHSASENNIVKDLCNGFNCWIGINLIGDGVWEWNDGSCIDYEYWWHNYPGDHIGHVKMVSNGKWLPSNDESEAIAICQYRNPSAPIASPTVSQPTCYGDYCYYRSCNMRNYSSACVNYGAQLPTIQSESENNIVRDLCNGFNCWIGMTLTGDGQREWNDGSNLSYENWWPNYPGDHIGHVKLVRNGRWLPTNNATKTITVCQFPSPSPTGAPSYLPTTPSSFVHSAYQTRNISWLSPTSAPSAYPAKTVSSLSPTNAPSVESSTDSAIITPPVSPTSATTASGIMNIPWSWFCVFLSAACATLLLCLLLIFRRYVRRNKVILMRQALEDGLPSSETTDKGEIGEMSDRYHLIDSCGTTTEGDGVVILDNVEAYEV